MLSLSRGVLAFVVLASQVVSLRPLNHAVAESVERSFLQLSLPSEGSSDWVTLFGRYDGAGNAMCNGRFDDETANGIAAQVLHPDALKQAPAMKKLLEAKIQGWMSNSANVPKTRASYTDAQWEGLRRRALRKTVGLYQTADFGVPGSNFGTPSAMIAICSLPNACREFKNGFYVQKMIDLSQNTMAVDYNRLPTESKCQGGPGGGQGGDQGGGQGGDQGDDNAGKKKEDDNAGKKKEDDNAGKKKEDDNAGKKKEDDNAGKKKEDDNAGKKKEDDNAGNKKEDDNAGKKNDSPSDDSSSSGAQFATMGALLVTLVAAVAA